MEVVIVLLIPLNFFLKVAYENSTALVIETLL